MKIKDLINWKLYFVLLIASVLSIIAILPYVTTIQSEILKSIPLPLPLLLLISVLQSTVLFAILIFIGLKLSKVIGLKIPIIESYLAKKKPNVNVKSIVKLSILLGVLSGLAIILFDFIFTKLGVNLMGQVSAPIWQGFLASFYGGISEELLLRLFFMTFIIWLISKLTRPKGKIIENKLLIWSSIIIAAIIFGIGHLPITSTLTPITPLVVTRAILLNGIGGVVFGWLYWKKGLESAMIAHFSADIILHVCLPLVLVIL